MALTPENWLGVYVLCLLLPIAVAVFWAGPHRNVNRLLATILVFEALAASGGRIQTALPGDGARAALSLARLGVLMVVLLYPLFLALVLDTPLLRPFQSRPGRITTLTLAGVFFALHVAFPWTYTDRPYLIGLAAVMVLALVSSVHAHHIAPRGSHRRRQARWFILIYGIRDAVFAPVALYLAFDLDNILVANIAIAVVISFYAPLLAYTILRTQLFDIDLKLKWTLRRGTLAGIFVATFIIATQLAENYAQRILEGYGWIVGSLVVGLLVFAITPLQRWADRLADRAMPRTTSTPEYVTYRKLEVYRAALESAIRDRHIDDPERRLLLRLRGRLGIDGPTAAALEAEVLEAAGLPRPARRAKPA